MIFQNALSVYRTISTLATGAQYRVMTVNWGPFLPDPYTMR
jgi:hypothetical protein